MNAPAVIRKSIITAEPSMDEAVARALALLDLLARLECVLTERQGEHCGIKHAGATACGFLGWGGDICAALHDDFEAAFEASRGRGGDKVSAARKFGATILKAKALLVMMGHDLSVGGWFEDYDGAIFDGELPKVDVSPYLTLAADCSEYLEASFNANFGPAVILADGLRTGGVEAADQSAVKGGAK